MEITANALQTVEVNQNVQFTETPVRGNCSIFHRDGSGLITLRGITNQCRARFKVTFNSNVALSEGTTVGPISLALAINGEAIGPATMISTPAAVGEYNNISSSIFINVPNGCCYTISVKNLTTVGDIDMQNANLLIERVA